MKRISADDHYTVIGEKQLAFLNNADIQPGKYVFSIYDMEWYVGCIGDCSDENNDVFINFMQ